jgi:hypothetical protein
MFRKLLRNRKGVTAMVILLVTTLVSIALIIPIGLMVTTELGEAVGLVSAKSGTTTHAENVTYDVFDSLWTAWSLSSLIPIIAVAAVLIAIIVGAFVFQRARG